MNAFRTSRPVGVAILCIALLVQMGWGAFGACRCCDTQSAAATEAAATAGDEAQSGHCRGGCCVADTATTGEAAEDGGTQDRLLRGCPQCHENAGLPGIPGESCCTTDVPSAVLASETEPVAKPELPERTFGTVGNAAADAMRDWHRPAAGWPLAEHGDRSHRDRQATLGVWRN